MMNILAETFRIVTRTDMGWERDTTRRNRRWPQPSDEDLRFLRRWRGGEVE